MATNLVYFWFLTFAALTTDEFYMARCLQLAWLGAGFVAPNPMVGAVLVYQNQVIGEGYHRVYGSAHAEVNCINSVEEGNKKFIPASTLYVSLEPCAHFGKTPPCADLIIKQQIPRVVIACRDPFEQVNGRGIGLLQQNGIQVSEGILKDQALELNKRFFCLHTKKRPYIFLKWAQTADGFIAGNDSRPLKISNDFSNRWVHKMRSTEAAIMIGTSTALTDNPTLSTRLWPGRNPLRVVIDKQLKIPAGAAIFDNSSPVIVFNALKNEVTGHIRYVKVSPSDEILPVLIRVLYESQVSSLIVEGGSVLLQSFLDAGLWDEMLVITNTTLRIQKGIAAVPLPISEPAAELRYGQDHIQVFKNAQL